VRQGGKASPERHVLFARYALAEENLVLGAGTRAGSDQGPVVFDPPFGDTVQRDRDAAIGCLISDN